MDIPYSKITKNKIENDTLTKIIPDLVTIEMGQSFIYCI